MTIPPAHLRSWSRRLWGRLQHPGVCASAFLTLAVSVLALGQDGFGESSTCADLVFGRQRGCFFSIRMHVRDGPSGLSRFPNPPDDYDALSTAVDKTPAEIVLVEPSRWTRRTGLFARIHVSEGFSVAAWRMDGTTVQPEDLRRYIALLEHEEGWPAGPPVALTFMPGGASQQTDRLDWVGVVHNTVAASSAAVFVLSLGCIPRARNRRRRRDRRAAGLCPACAYDRRATPPDAPCPECGSPFKIDP